VEWENVPFCKKEVKIEGKRRKGTCKQRGTSKEGGKMKNPGESKALKVCMLAYTIREKQTFMQ